MPLPQSWLRTLLAAVLLMTGLLELAQAQSVAQAQTSTTSRMSLPPTPSSRTATLRGSDGVQPLDSTDPCLTTPLASVAPPTSNISDPELQNLARALKDLPNLIYEYVHNNIQTLPQFDSLKGPVGALLDGKGTPVDQAELMALLLRISSYPDAMVEYGQETLSASQVGNWLGVDVNHSALVGQILNSGDFTNNASITPDVPVGTVTLSWAWVKVTINGQVTYFDPATKSYNQDPGLGNATVVSEMGLNVANFIAGAEPVGSGFSMTPLPLASVTGLSATYIQGQLGAMSSALVANLRESQPAAATQDIIGGTTIAAFAPNGSYGQTASFSASGTGVTDYDPTAVSGASGSLPRVQFRLNLPGNSAPAVVNTSDVYGHSLYVFFSSSTTPSQNNIAGLWLDNVELASAGATSPQNGDVKATFQVCYPTGANSGALNLPGSSAAQDLFKLDFRIAQPNLIYVLSNLWGPTGRGVVERQRRLLEAARAAAKASGTAPVLGTPYEPLFRSLTTLGLTWGAEYSRVQDIADRAAGTLTVSRSTVGLVGLTLRAGAYTPYFDLGFKAFTPNILTVPTAPAAGTYVVDMPVAVETLDSGMVSILETAVLEQTQPNMQAASMSKLFALAGQPGQPNSTTIYDFNDNPTRDTNIHNAQVSWYNSIIIGAGYNSSDRATLDCWILQGSCGQDNNFRVFVPGKANLALGSYAGSAYWAYGNGAPPPSPNVINSQGTQALGTYLSGNVDTGTGAAAGSDTNGQPATPSSTALDTLGNLQKWSDPDLAQVNFAYTGGHLTLISSNVGSGGISRTLRLEYNDTTTFPNQVTNVCALSSPTSTATCEAPDVQLPNGQFVRASYVYNSTGQLSTYTDPNSKVTQFNYDGNGRLNQVFYPVLSESTTPNKSPDIANFYDTLGRLMAQQNADAYANKGALIAQYYVAGSRTEIDDAAGDAFVTYYDPRGNSTYGIDALGNTTSYTYDGLSRLATKTLPESNSFAYNYDNSLPAHFLNLLSETDTKKVGSNTSPATRTRSWTYDPTFNKVSSTTDFRGNITLFAIDPTYGWTNSVTLPKPTSTGTSPVYNFRYNALGQVSQETDPPSQGNPSGRVTQFIYGDTYSDLTTTIVDAVAGGLYLTTQYGYDAGGNLSTLTAPRDYGRSPAVVTGFAYDADRHMTTISSPSPGGTLPPLSTSMGYDDDGQMLSVTRNSGSSSVNNQVTQFTYTPTEKVATMIDASNDTTIYSYDIADRLVATADGQARVTSSSYDADSRVSLICQGNTAVNLALTCGGETPVEQRTYWPNGTPRQRQYYTAAHGWQGLLYTPDGYDRLQRIAYPDGTFENMQYNAADDVLNHTSRGGETVSWGYDYLHRMVTKTGLPNLAYSYDQASNLTSVTVTGTNGSNYGGVPQSAWSIGYDSAGRKTSDTGVLGTLIYGLDPNGNRISLTYPNGTAITTQYDELDRPGQIQGFGATASTNIVTTRFDPFDRPYSRLLGNSTRWYTNFSYDLQGQYNDGLANASGLDLTRVFDNEGGTTANPVSSDLDYTFDLAHKILKVAVFPGSVLAHPVAGNTLAGLSANLSNELLNPAAGQTLTYNADGYLTSDGMRSYTYDGDGDGHILSAQNGSIGASYQFDAFGRRIAKTVNGQTTQYLLDDRGNEVGEYDGSGHVLDYLVYDVFQTAPDLALDTGGNPTSYYQVDRIGSVVATSSGNALANTYSYLPYGDTPTGTLPTGTKFGYAGYRYDAETRTYHTATRQYDPRIGRFLQTDPIGQAGGNNIYAYAGGDPVNGADPSGMGQGDGTDHESLALGGGGCGGCEGSSGGSSSSVGGVGGGGVGSSGGGSGSAGASTVGVNSGSCTGACAVDAAARQRVVNFINNNDNGASFFSAYSGIGYDQNGRAYSEGGQDNYVSGVLDIIGKIWNLPNTTIGLAYGGIGLIAGEISGTNPDVSLGNNAIQFTGNPLNVSAVTLGNTINYSPGYQPNYPSPESPYHTIAEHEEQHTYQGQAIGPGYLPATVSSLLLGVILNGNSHDPASFMERGPQSDPPRPF